MCIRCISIVRAKFSCCDEFSVESSNCRKDGSWWKVSVVLAVLTYFYCEHDQRGKALPLTLVAIAHENALLNVIQALIAFGNAYGNVVDLIHLSELRQVMFAVDSRSE